MRIRRYEGKDAAPLSKLFARAVQGIGPRDYSARQVSAWLSRRPSAERLHRLAGDGRVLLVAVDDDDQPLGFIDLEANGHIDYLYCAPEVAGEGVAAALYLELEALARGRGLGGLHVEASEAARRFFLKQGFTVLKRRELVVAGVQIHNYAMAKSLSYPRDHSH